MADRRDDARLAPADIERARQWIKEARALLAGLDDPVALDQLRRLSVAEAFLRRAEAANRRDADERLARHGTRERSAAPQDERRRPRC